MRAHNTREHKQKHTAKQINLPFIQRGEIFMTRRRRPCGEVACRKMRRRRREKGVKKARKWEGRGSLSRSLRGENTTKKGGEEEERRKKKKQKKWERAMWRGFPPCFSPLSYCFTSTCYHSSFRPFWPLGSQGKSFVHPMTNSRSLRSTCAVQMTRRKTKRETADTVSTLLIGKKWIQLLLKMVRNWTDIKRRWTNN